MESAFITQLDTLDTLVVERADIGRIRNLIASLREQAEAEAKRTAELMEANQTLITENQKVIAGKAAIEQELAKLKAQYLASNKKTPRKSGIPPFTSQM